MLGIKLEVVDFLTVRVELLYLIKNILKVVLLFDLFNVVYFGVLKLDFCLLVFFGLVDL